MGDAEAGKPDGGGLIIEAANFGERDPEKLRDWALTDFGRNQK